MLNVAQPRQRADADKADKPECYGTGQIQVPLKDYHAYDWVRVHPQTCFDCDHEQRCLRQQKRWRRP